MELYLVSTLGERVKSSRLKLNLDQDELADLAGCSQQSITKIENDMVRNSSFLESIAKVLNVNYKWLKNGVAGEDLVNGIDSKKDLDSFMKTAEDALKEAINGVKAVNVQRGEPFDKLDEPLLQEAFSIALKGKMGGNYIAAALEKRLKLG